MHPILELNQSQWLKPHVECNIRKKNRRRNKWWKRWKSIVQVNEQYIKTMKTLRTDVKLGKNEKNSFK